MRSRSPVGGRLIAARLLALSQGMVWFFLLIHGGLGLVAGPAGWAASVIGNRAFNRWYAV